MPQSTCLYHGADKSLARPGRKQDTCVCVCVCVCMAIFGSLMMHLYMYLYYSPQNCRSACVYIKVFQVSSLCDYIGASKDERCPSVYSYNKKL
jgi:hypothetical protein